MRPVPTALAVLVVAFAAAGCGSSGSAEPAATTAPTTPAASTPAETPSPSESESQPSESQPPEGTTLEVAVVGKKVTPAPGTVSLAAGEDVTLVLTTDRSGELHVHAADPELETEIEPGTKSFTFTTPSQPGVYEVELHDPDLLLFKVKVQ